MSGHSYCQCPPLLYLKYLFLLFMGFRELVLDAVGSLSSWFFEPASLSSWMRIMAFLRASKFISLPVVVITAESVRRISGITPIIA